MKKKTESKIVNDAFDISVTIKGVDGIIEFIVGFLLLFFKPNMIQGPLLDLSSHELAVNHTFIGNYLFTLAGHISARGELFTSLFLMSHGIIKVLLVAALLTKKLWAYPLAMIVFGIFAILQTVEIFRHFSLWLSFVTVLDIAIIVLTALEYRKIKAK